MCWIIEIPDETVKALLKKKIFIKKIAEVTGLTVEEIEKLAV